jgi:hypothetical protein
MKYLCPLLSVLFFFSCRDKNRDKSVVPQPVKISKGGDTAYNFRLVDSVEKLVRTGDLILRTGNDYTSFFFKQMNLQDKTFSHCGLALNENGKVFVYHALGGEFNPDQKILRQTLRQFVNPLENEIFGVYHLQLPSSIATDCLKKADSLYRAGVMFDLGFDLATDHRMYCAEFVYKSLVWGSKSRFRTDHTKIGNREGIATDNLYLNPYFKPLGRYKYK